MLNIRKFVQGKDEAVWVSIWNRAFREFEEFRDMTADEMMIDEKSPSFDAEGRFIAELEGEPVGIVNAYVDKMRTEKKGFVRALGVVPEHRQKGIGRALAEKAIESLKQRGMEVVEVGASLDRPEGTALYKSLGFNKVRVFSLMKKDLEKIPSGVGENQNVQLKKLRKGSLEDLRLLNSLSNDAFSEHYNHRSHTIEETQFFVEEDPLFKQQEWWFVFLQEKPVGYVGIGIDETYNREKNEKAGWILDIGVLKPHRTKGIGKRLMIEGMKQLKAKDMTEAMLGVDDQNVTHAIKLYEKVGFHAARKDAAYQRPLQ